MDEGIAVIEFSPFFKTFCGHNFCIITAPRRNIAMLGAVNPLAKKNFAGRMWRETNNHEMKH